MNATVPPDARRAMDLAREGDLPGAIGYAEAALRETPDDPGLRMFVGILRRRTGDLVGALPHFRRAAALLPSDPLPKLELARAQISTGAFGEAEQLIAGLHLAGRGAEETVRLRGLLHRARGEHRAAAIAFESLGGACDADDLVNLGESRLALGDAAGAVAAFAVSLRVLAQPAVRLRLADAQVAGGAGEAAIAAAYALAEAGADPFAWVVVARLEDHLERSEASEQSLRRALALDPRCHAALLALARLLERSNRLDELATVLGQCADAGIVPQQTALVRAQLLKRRGNLAGALATLRAGAESEDTSAPVQLAGEILDRLGEHGEAFAAFAEMNRLVAAEVDDAAGAAARYRARIARLAAVSTPDWFARWRPAPADAQRPPAFVFGFPRSGTTLLDTILMGHGGTLVLEEPEILPAISREQVSVDGVADLDVNDIVRLRARYRELAMAAGGEAGGRLIVDKSPLGSTGAPLAHRLFPDARYVFVERHPCDVVLSCFMTRMRADEAGANFLSLEDTAELYDAVFGYWEQCSALLPLAVHRLRYARMIADKAAELRPLFGFLGLNWDADVLDHVRTAERRRFIATPSYAQVTQPIYRHADGRWTHYRAQLEPVLPILAPWVEKMGYRL